MPKGITYFCTDSTGQTHCRYSSGHQEPHYFTACVTRSLVRETRKNDVSYSATVARAPSWVAKYPDTYFADIVPVRAYQGNWKHEPSADLRVDVLR
jgi:hypothetical protein